MIFSNIFIIICSRSSHSSWSIDCKVVLKLQLCMSELMMNHMFWPEHPSLSTPYSEDHRLRQAQDLAKHKGYLLKQTVSAYSLTTKAMLFLPRTTTSIYSRQKGKKVFDKDPTALSANFAPIPHHQP
mmetsp:Transcript_13168/g.15078  ORF Transcript_13168/g.15078 Transcript_13168/m.15078 type:complete len:127 (+) Transcript_13168:1138-1518(+)